MRTALGSALIASVVWAITPAIASDNYVIVDSVTAGDRSFSFNLAAFGDLSEVGSFSGYAFDLETQEGRFVSVIVPGYDKIEQPIAEWIESNTPLETGDDQSFIINNIASWEDRNLERSLLVAQSTANEYHSSISVTNDPIPLALIPAVLAGSVVAICTIDRIYVYLNECEKPEFNLSLENAFTCNAKCS